MKVVVNESLAVDVGEEQCLLLLFPGFPVD